MAPLHLHDLCRRPGDGGIAAGLVLHSALMYV